MKNRINISLILLAVTVFLPGCLATSREMTVLKDDISQLMQKLNEVQQNQADLALKMDAVNTNIEGLNYKLEETQGRMSLLGQRLDDVESNLSNSMSKFSQQLSGANLSSTPSPSELYKAAYSDFSRGKYDLAIVGLRSYLEKFPQGELAAQAQYYLGEAYYSQEDWNSALKELKVVGEKYPSSEPIPAARLKQALCLEQLNKNKEAQVILESIVKDFPKSPEAFTAQEKLTPRHNDGK